MKNSLNTEPNNSELFKQALEQAFKDKHINQYFDVNCVNILREHYTKSIERFQALFCQKAEELEALNTQILGELTTNTQPYQEQYQGFCEDFVKQYLEKGTLDDFYSEAFEHFLRLNSQYIQNQQYSDALRELNALLQDWLEERLDYCTDIINDLDRIHKRIQKSETFDDITADERRSPSGPTRSEKKRYLADPQQRQAFESEERKIQRAVELGEQEAANETHRLLMNEMLKSHTKSTANKVAKKLSYDDDQSAQNGANSTMQTTSSERGKNSAKTQKTTIATRPIGDQTENRNPNPEPTTPIKIHKQSAPSKAKPNTIMKPEKNTSANNLAPATPTTIQSLSTDEPLPPSATKLQDTHAELEEIIVEDPRISETPTEIITKNLKAISQKNKRLHSTLKDYNTMLENLRKEAQRNEGHLSLTDVDLLIEQFAPIATLCAQAQAQSQSLEKSSKEEQNKWINSINDFYQSSYPILANKNAGRATMLLTLVMGAAGAALGFGACAFFPPALLVAAPMLGATYAGIQLLTALSVSLCSLIFAGTTASYSNSYFFSSEIKLNAVKHCADEATKLLKP